jgi:HK97 family phage major capsid protein
MDFSRDCILEIGDLQHRAETLASGTASQREQAKALLSRIATLRSTGFSSLEMQARYADVKTEALRKESGFTPKAEKNFRLTTDESRKLTPLFEEYLRQSPSTYSADMYERRATVMLGRPISQTYSGTDGGQLVPLDFSENFFLGLAQTDPLLDENNVTLEKSDSYALPSSVAAEWDLSTIAAVKPGGTGNYGDAIQQTGQTVPATQASLLDPTIYKFTLEAALELVQDDPKLLDRIAKAMSIGFARGIGADLVNGSGNGFVPQGILTGAVDSGITIGTGLGSGFTASTGNVTNEDLLNVYFSLNRVYRNSPKCAWVMNDSTYQRIRASKDNAERPLISVVDDEERLLGKKILISPSMPGSGTSSPFVAGSIVFGDLSYYRVRLSQLAISKTLEVGNGAENGIFWYIGRQRAAAQVIDPTNGTTPPIIYAATT